MDEFKRNVAKSKREVRIIIAIMTLLPLVGLIVVGMAHVRGDRKMIENYLGQERPNAVLLAIETYKSENGRYPDAISNALPRYYKGRQDEFQFLAWYEYKNFETNFFLKDFIRSYQDASDSAFLAGGASSLSRRSLVRRRILASRVSQCPYGANHHRI